MGTFLIGLATHIAGGIFLGALGIWWSRATNSPVARRAIEALISRDASGTASESKSSVCPWHAAPVSADQTEEAPAPLPRRKRPLLRACLTLGPDDVRRLGRVPLEFNLLGSTRQLAWLLLRALTLRPSSKKSFFVAQCIRRRQATAGNSTLWDFPLGGHELCVRLRNGEDHRHLRRSLRRGSDAWKQLVVLADVDGLVSCNSELECFVTNAYATDRKPSSAGELVLRSSDPLLADKGPYVSLPCWAVPRDALWLVDAGIESGERIPPDAALAQAAGMPLDPRLLRLPRMLMYWSLVLLFGIAVLMTLLFGTVRDEASATGIVSSLSIALVLWLAYCGMHLWRYLAHELRHWQRWRRIWRLKPRFWIARTTRCFADGDRIRSGHSIDRKRKYA